MVTAHAYQSIDAIVSMSYRAIDHSAVRSATTAQVTTTGLARPRHWTLLMHGFPAGDTIGAPPSMIALHDSFSGCIHAATIIGLFARDFAARYSLQQAPCWLARSLKAKYSTRMLMTFRSTDTGLGQKPLVNKMLGFRPTLVPCLAGAMAELTTCSS